jgi:hypothetical protein
MSYSVICKRFQVIFYNSKLNKKISESPYMNMDISCKICIAKDIGAL